MRPIFTVHAGEYLVASEIEHRFPNLRVWVPSKDTGIDLLVTDESQNKVASIQVKFSKDHLATGKEARATSQIKSGGWWKLDREKLAESTADLWVLVLCDLHSRRYDFVIVPPLALAKRYMQIAPESKTIQSYFWVTHAGRCWETRGLNKVELSLVCSENFQDKPRDFTGYLNVWPFKTAPPGE
jgi:hypothetical protein